MGLVGKIILDLSESECPPFPRWQPFACAGHSLLCRERMKLKIVPRFDILVCSQCPVSVGTRKGRGMSSFLSVTALEKGHCHKPWISWGTQ